MISAFLVLAFVLIAATILNSPWFKGVVGEYKVNSLLKNKLDKKNYRIFKDILLPTENGTTQIDHIVVSRYGIFAIETKNMSHWIFANNGPYWRQRHYNWSVKFQNPINQNYKHLKTLENLYGEVKGLIKNIVVFTGNCEFKTDIDKNVMKLNRLIKHIKSFENQIIDNNVLENFVKKIEQNKLKNTLINRIKHIQHVDKILVSKGHDGEILKKMLIKYAFKIVIPLIFLLIAFLMLENVSKQSSKMFSNIIASNIENQNKIKQKQQATTQQQSQQKSPQYASREPQQIVETSDNQSVILKKPAPYRSAIYSWTNERGQRVFSNVGFPMDKQYTEPRIEWR